jgi:hypothetical protein
MTKATRIIASLFFTFGGVVMADSNRIAGDKLWTLIEGTTWYDTGAFAGGTMEFFKDSHGNRRAKHILFGSGLPEIGRSEGTVSIDGTVIKIRVDPEKDGSYHVEPDYVYDQQASVFLTDSCKNRLIPDNKSQSRLAIPLYETLSAQGRSAILAAFNSPDASTVREAICAWTDLWWKDQHSENFREVVKFLDDSRSDIRAYAVWSCGTMIIKEAFPKLLQALSDKDVRVRREAALALRPGIAAGYEKETQDALTKVVAQDSDPAMRQAAKMNLERFSK